MFSILNGKDNAVSAQATGGRVINDCPVGTYQLKQTFM